MLLRKINAVLSLLSTFLLMGHAVSQAVWMLSRESFAKPAGYISWILLGVMAIHIFISIDLALSAHMEPQTRKGKNYPKQNVSTIVQRVSGILMIVFTGLHIAGATGVMQPPQFVHFIVPPLFFALSLVHVSVSASKALITLGIGNAKTIKVVDIIVKIICALTLIADIIGFYLDRV